ncbi:MAG: hypothetical protein AAF869_07185, partial [Pseudomonadota bacterium]
MISARPYVRLGFRSALLSSCAVAATCAFAPAAFAQDSRALDRIVVTAERKENDLQRVPIAVTAISGDAVERADIS